MKLNKSYIVKIDGNKSKINYLKSNLIELDKLSQYVFSLGKEKWSDQKELYRICREKFPLLNSKVLQNFISLYQPKQGRSIPKKKYIKAGIFVDQSFNVQKSDTKLTNYWLKFHRKRFPLFGKKNLERISDLKNIKLVQIFVRKGKLYCKLTEVKEIVNPVGSVKLNEIVGLDINSARIVLSNNKFYHLRKLKHRKIEHYKNKQLNRNLNNFTKNVVHNITSKIVKDLLLTGMKVLVLEDLRTLRKNCTTKERHKGTSKRNYVVNSIPTGMFKNFLTYKCNQNGIKVATVNPAYTSQTCSRCHLIGNRNKYDFVCIHCGFKLDADLVGSRNIKNRYTHSL